MQLLPGKAMFGGGAKPPPPPPPPPTPEDPEVKRRKKEVSQAAQRRRGLMGTVKTDGQGDTTEPNVQRANLLGQSGTKQS